MNGRKQPATVSPPDPGRPWIRPLVGGIALIVIVAVTMTGWDWWRLPGRVRAALPENERSEQQPAQMTERFAAATALLGSRDSLGEGVAELGRLYHANGRAVAAERCWRILELLQPREGRWPYYLADLRRGAGDYAGMAELLRKTVRLAPAYAPAWLNLADLEFKRGDMEAARRAYRSRLAIVPGDPHARLGLVRIARQSGRDDEARRQLAELVRDVPDFSPGLNLHAEVLAESGDQAAAAQERWRGHQAGRFLEAEDPWLTELQAWCYDFGRLCVLGTIAYDNQQGDRGVSLLERAITVAPDNPAGYEILAGTQLKLGQPAAARATLERGLRRPTLEAPSVMYYFHLSDACRQLQQPGPALEVARTGLAQVGETHELYNAAGMALGDLGRYDEAIAAFRRARQLDPNNVNTNFNLAFALLNHGQRAEAVGYLEHTLTVEPHYRRALEILGHQRIEAGDWEGAGRYFEPLLEAYPGVPEVRRVVIEWHRQAGLRADEQNDAVAAERHFRAVLALILDDVDANASLGVLLLSHDRAREALGPLEAFRRLRPSDPQGAMFVGQAYAQLGRLDDARRLLTEATQLAERSGAAALAAQCREMLQHLATAP